MFSQIHDDNSQNDGKILFCILDRYFLARKSIIKIVKLPVKNHPFSRSLKFSEKLAFLTH